MPKKIQRPNRVRTGNQKDRNAPQQEYEMHQPTDLWQFFRKSPLVGLELEFERDKDTGREIDL
ncbi:MAG TPA: hypothetical protein VG649_16760 [Candidatus Angelobacter sp.]|jgi:hypothetical protein|nr:hypothetical protein [Candidatus Angelobacter sp.]